jgi:hypothetical protein
MLDEVEWEDMQVYLVCKALRQVCKPPNKRTRYALR